MEIVGRVESLWRYPVKGMRGEVLPQAFVGFAGIYGDRIYAFTSSAAPKGFPFFTPRDQRQMLLYQPKFRHPEQLTGPLNLLEAEAMGPGITPIYASGMDLAVDVETPTEEVLAIDDPRLVSLLKQGIRESEIGLIRSERALTDCRPVSLFALRTAQHLGEKLGIEMDKRRFRANVYMELDSQEAFSENSFTGRKLRIGEKVVVAILERDPRCKMITLDPATGDANPEIARLLARDYGTTAGVYAAVLVEGMIAPNDPIALLA